MSPQLQRYVTQRSRLINRALAAAVPRKDAFPPIIHEAVRYSLLAGGKRLRPILCLAACEAVGGQITDVLSAACALECIHTYSLIHDDLPAMDNAAVRRGKPTVHRRYGEAIAILAGDALLSMGFELLARGNHAARRLAALQVTAQIVGTKGLIGGQVMDLAWQRTSARLKAQGSRKLLEYINAHKTAKLMSLSTRLGALLGGGTPQQIRAFERYGFWLGMVFQITDDLLDREGLTLVVGNEAARRQALAAARRAQRCLRGLDRRAEPLRQLVDAIVWRTQ